MDKYPQAHGEGRRVWRALKSPAAGGAFEEVVLGPENSCALNRRKQKTSVKRVKTIYQEAPEEL